MTEFEKKEYADLKEAFNEGNPLHVAKDGKPYACHSYIDCLLEFIHALIDDHPKGFVDLPYFLHRIIYGKTVKEWESELLADKNMRPYSWEPYILPMGDGNKPLIAAVAKIIEFVLKVFGNSHQHSMWLITACIDTIIMPKIEKRLKENQDESGI